MPAPAAARIEVSIQCADGSSTELEVEPGTTVAVILDHEDLTLPPGYNARLISEAAEALQPDCRIWEPQACPD